ncbi:AraC family ligand binding domain-containing protein [Erysipelothrix sp. D19-032]
MKEHILSFLPSHFQTPTLFRIEIAGITYPFTTYHVQRQHSHIYSFEYVVSGSGTLRIDGVEYIVQQGDVFFYLSTMITNIGQTPKILSINYGLMCQAVYAITASNISHSQ